MTNLDKAWTPLIPQLADDYIQWKYVNTMSPPELPPTPDWDAEIKVLDLFSSERTVIVRRDAETELSRALVRHGYLGVTPVNPSLAISLRTLEHFRLLRLFKPSFSVEAFTKLLCYHYVVSVLQRPLGA